MHMVVWNRIALHRIVWRKESMSQVVEHRVKRCCRRYTTNAAIRDHHLRLLTPDSNSIQFNLLLLLCMQLINQPSTKDIIYGDMKIKVNQISGWLLIKIHLLCWCWAVARKVYTRDANECDMRLKLQQRLKMGRKKMQFITNHYEFH